MVWVFIGSKRVFSVFVCPNVIESGHVSSDGRAWVLLAYFVRREVVDRVCLLVLRWVVVARQHFPPFPSDVR